MTPPLAPGAAARAVGLVLAALVPAGSRPALAKRAAIVAGSDAAAGRLGPVGWTVVSITPDEGETISPTKQAIVDGVATAGWTLQALLVLFLFDHLPLPRLVRSLLLGGLYYVGDLKMKTFVDAMTPKALEAKAAASATAQEASEAAQQTRRVDTTA